MCQLWEVRQLHPQQGLSLQRSVCRRQRLKEQEASWPQLMPGCQLQPSGGSAHLPLCRLHLYTEFPVPLSAAVMSSVLAELWQLGPAGVLPFSPLRLDSRVQFISQRSGLALLCGCCLGISPTAQKIFKVKIQHCLRVAARALCGYDGQEAAGQHGNWPFPSTVYCLLWRKLQSMLVSQGNESILDEHKLALLNSGHTLQKERAQGQRKSNSPLGSGVHSTRPCLCMTYKGGWGSRYRTKSYSSTTPV